MGDPRRHASASVDEISVGEDGFAAELARPVDAEGLVLLAHGEGGDRHSARSHLVAGMFNEHRLATLQFDVTRPAESAGRGEGHLAASAGRIVQALDWAHRQRELARLRCGLFVAGEGATAALSAAVERPMLVAALVTCCGRPDLAADALGRVMAPAMLIVGGNDTEVVEINRAALRRLTCMKRLEVVPRATRHFLEPGALVTAVELAAWWFGLHLPAGGKAATATAD